MKYVISAALAFLMSFSSAALCACGAKETTASASSSSMPPEPVSENSSSAANAEETEGESFTVSFDTGAEDYTIDSVRVKPGARAVCPKVNREGYALRQWLCEGKVYDFSAAVTSDLTLTAMWLERTNLPVTMIELYDGDGGEFGIESVTREEDVACSVSVVNAEGEYEVMDAPSALRGRGNGSWGIEKKCFRVRFDKKQSLFGRAAGKHWVLNACGNDDTLMLNYTAYTLAGSVFDNLEYVTCAVMTDLYVNGEYRGVYLLCEQVRAGNGRVEIGSEYGVADTGYLIEYDAYAKGERDTDHFSINDSDRRLVTYHFSVHSPDPSGYAEAGVTKKQYKEQVAYIKDYVKRAYEAMLVHHDFDAFCELVDVDSVVDMYILLEFCKNTDAGWSSLYLYKKAGGKLYFGPPWDFDLSANVARGEEGDPTGIYVADTVRNYVPYGNTANELFVELYKNEAFLSLVKSRWQTLSPKIGRFFVSLFSNAFFRDNAFAYGKNYVRWNGDSRRFDWTEPYTAQNIKPVASSAEKRWKSLCVRLKNWYSGRIAFLDGEWA